MGFNNQKDHTNSTSLEKGHSMQVQLHTYISIITTANTLDMLDFIETVKTYQIIRQVKRVPQNKHI